jgi:hypothetical protein
MNINRSLSIAITALVIAILACNLPAQKPNTNGVLPTIAAAQPAGVATSAPAAALSTPIVTVSTATNCRTGPSIDYDLVLVFQPGATAEVVGKYTPANYWLIKTPTGGTCWLWGAYATVQGNVSTLAEIAPPAPPPPPPSAVAQNPTKAPKAPKPPTATSFVAINPGLKINPGIIQALAKPSAPGHLYITTTCTYNAFHVLSVRTDHLSWPSVSNATGYNVYENGSKISGTTGTSINLIGASTTGNVSFGVAAYNSNGTSTTTNASSHCP